MLHWQVCFSAGDLSDLLMAHASWFTYAGMTRIYKHYHTALHHPAVRTQSASFSSYAGEPFPVAREVVRFQGGRLRLRITGFFQSCAVPHFGARCPSTQECGW